MALQARSSSKRAASDGTKTNGAAPKARVLKVDQAKLDTLMNLVGELVLSKNSAGDAMRDYGRAPAADLGGVLPVPPAGAGQKIRLKMEGEETAADKAN